MNAPLRHVAVGAPAIRCGGIDSVARAIGERAAQAMGEELETWPKPGLVSLLDSGSHRDMDAGTLWRSIAALTPFMAALARAGGTGAAMDDLRRIGRAAEAAMLAATGGINTHRGTIFGLGLLCAAAGARAAGLDPGAPTLGAIVQRRWGAAILAGPVEPASHGADAARRYGAGGARREAARGFPSLYGVALPALRAGFAAAGREGANVQACFALIAALEDTNLLHRGGPRGLAFARGAARRFLDEGGVAGAAWPERAAAVHRAFVARHLSPGGSADLLAMALFVDALGDQAGHRP